MEGKRCKNGTLTTAVQRLVLLSAGFFSTPTHSCRALMLMSTNLPYYRNPLSTYTASFKKKNPKSHVHDIGVRDLPPELQPLQSMSSTSPFSATPVSYGNGHCYALPPRQQEELHGTLPPFLSLILQPSPVHPSISSFNHARTGLC